jgi:CxxC motif-containing protein (DUF1111 family)
MCSLKLINYQTLLIMKKLSLLLLITILISCQNDDDVTETETPTIPNIDARTMAGGETTVFDDGVNAFGHPSQNLNMVNFDLHELGDDEFETVFSEDPNSENPGLGAQFNNTSCIACHPSDGRATFPQDINTLSGFFLRVSIPGAGGDEAAPGFGFQLTNHAVFGKEPEVQFGVTYEDMPVTFADGTRVLLRKPTYMITNSYIPIPTGAQFSPRLAQPVFGLGLLEAITANDILALEDINDVDSDGISGKANMVFDPETETTKLGRFGWKAGAPSVLVQTAGAYNGDMGITTPLFPTSVSFGQTNGDNDPNATPEISQEILDQVALYCRTLAVPAARNLDDDKVIRGFNLFEDAKCTACHTPKFVTGTFQGIPAISNQTIYPYTDMLLHDMGDDLADGRSEGLADGKEWKTRPLWGIGLTNIVNGHMNFLHDGRARTLEEAILWHGGEAENSKQFYTNLNEDDRDALLAFIKAL